MFEKILQTEFSLQNWQHSKQKKKKTFRILFFSKRLGQWSCASLLCKRMFVVRCLCVREHFSYLKTKMNKDFLVLDWVAHNLCIEKPKQMAFDSNSEVSLNLLLYNSIKYIEYRTLKILS